ncbi:MAG: HNH endonuclease [Betaproteobacteria bacterium]|nr:HNH endonuclease [Betaproteobacteria bacterium]
MIDCKGCGLAKRAIDYRIHKRGYRVGKCKECERAYQKEWSARHSDVIRKRKRESMARRRAADPQAARDYRNAYHSANREARTEKMREYYQRRFFWGKAMKLRGPNRATARDLAMIWKVQRGRCALTGRRLDRAAQLDHKLAKARGGGDELANLQWLCEEANLAKRALTDSEFVALCSDVMRWIGERIQMVEQVADE